MTIQTLLFPTDFSDCAEGAFSHAAFLAERFGATLHVLHNENDETQGPPSPRGPWGSYIIRGALESPAERATNHRSLSSRGGVGRG